MQSNKGVGYKKKQKMVLTCLSKRLQFNLRSIQLITAKETHALAWAGRQENNFNLDQQDGMWRAVQCSDQYHGLLFL